MACSYAQYPPTPLYHLDNPAFVREKGKNKNKEQSKIIPALLLASIHYYPGDLFFLRGGVQPKNRPHSFAIRNRSGREAEPLGTVTQQRPPHLLKGASGFLGTEG